MNKILVLFFLLFATKLFSAEEVERFLPEWNINDSWEVKYSFNTFLELEKARWPTSNTQEYYSSS